MPEDSTTDDFAERHAISAMVRRALAKLPRRAANLLPGVRSRSRKRVPRARVVLSAVLAAIVAAATVALLKSASQVREVEATVSKVQMTFGDFGIHVSVSAPPADETVSP